MLDASDEILLQRALLIPASHFRQKASAGQMDWHWDGDTLCTVLSVSDVPEIDRMKSLSMVHDDLQQSRPFVLVEAILEGDDVTAMIKKDVKSIEKEVNSHKHDEATQQTLSSLASQLLRSAEPKHQDDTDLEESQAILADGSYRGSNAIQGLLGLQAFRSSSSSPKNLRGIWDNLSHESQEKATSIYHSHTSVTKRLRDILPKSLRNRPPLSGVQ